MNVREVHPPSHSEIPVSHYIEAVAVLNLFTLWLGVAIQKESHFFQEDSSLWQRTFWPLFYAYGVISQWVESTIRRTLRHPCPPSATDKEQP